MVNVPFELFTTVLSEVVGVDEDGELPSTLSVVSFLSGVPTEVLANLGDLCRG